MMNAGDIGPFEGLIYSTAARYAPYLDEEMEDIQQLLRIKVWQALSAFDRNRTGEALKGATDARERFVFSCVANRVKDMLKAQSRLNDRRNGAQIYVEDQLAHQSGQFEAQHMAVGEEAVFADVDEPGYELPSTLSEFELKIVHLLLLDFTQTEAARLLEVPRGRVRAAHIAIKEKMADWAPGTALPLPLALAA